MTELIGPAGAGKTIALAQWREALLTSGVKVAWYTAAEREREPALFIRMLASAIHNAGVDMTQTGLLHTEDAEPERALDALLLALEFADEDIVIVIDAFDRIETPDTNGLLQVLVETAPERVHVALSARRKPELAVSHLRVQGAVQVIDSSELRFNGDEISRLMDMPADSQDLAMIIERTEGWPVAVELFRIWRQRSGGTEDLSRHFGGRFGDLADFLAEQVFSTLTTEQQSLLADLSIFDEVEPGLVDTVRQRTDSALLLDGLASALPGLIGCRTDGSPRGGDGYRIHPLLVEYARAQSKLPNTHVCELHRRATDWFERQGRYPEAIAHAQSVGDQRVLTRLLSELRPWHVFSDGGASELRAILRGLPLDQIAAHPRLRVMAALAYFKSGLFREAWTMLEAVRSETRGFIHDPHGHDTDLQIEGYAIELLCRVYLEGTEIDDAFLTTAIKAAAPNDPLIWVSCETAMSVILEMRGDLAGAREALARSEAICRSMDMTRFTGFWLQYHHVFLALAHGAYRKSADLAASMSRLPLERMVSDVPILAMAKIATAASIYERRFVEDAAEDMREGLALFGEAEAWFEPYAIAHPILAEIAYRRGGLAEMDHFVKHAMVRAEIVGVRHTDQLLIAVRAAWLIRADELETASKLIAHVRAIGEKDAALPWRLTDAVATALALWALANGEPREAAKEAAAMIVAGERGQRLRTRVKGHLLNALALDALGDTAAARREMETALNLAAEEHATAVVAEEGHRVEALVQIVSATGEASAGARRHAAAVLRALTLGRHQINALSERELQIVTCMRDGASNKLIARRLGLTENTIKYHMKRIFAKLGVTNRSAASAASLSTALPAEDETST
ncbi:LuxR C-terminal-related transcriptional regulator [Sphingomonas sp.]|uniref:LuxR C-terminal-related transcriptional regulator n=1 Tax=Sphingomonas sp. TaxID=28214 RepID=UPI003D6CA54C